RPSLMSDDFNQRVDGIERTALVDPDDARKQLRVLLFEEGRSGETGSVGDALAILAQHNAQYRDLTSAILRFLAIPGLSPETNPKNQIGRSVVALATGSHPDLCSFLGVSLSLQTFENYNILRGTHDRVCALLAPLQMGSTNLDLFLAARHPILQSLNHSA